jgi:hypothetical protein
MKTTLFLRTNLLFEKLFTSLPNSNSVLNNKISLSVLLWFPVTKNVAASQIRFDPNISDLGDLAIPHAIVCVNKLLKLLFTIHYDII